MPGRRHNNEGSIYQRASDGRWTAQLTDPISGKRKSYYGKTADDVVRQLDEAKHALRTGLPLLDERQTLGQYLQSWYAMKQSQLKESSLRPYRNDIELRLTPHLGRTPLVKLTPQQIQLFISKLSSEGVAPKTIIDCLGVLRAALQDALHMGLIHRNVADQVKAPRKATPRMYIFSLAEIRRFLEQVRGDRFEALYVLAFGSGMREGELLGLRWQDIDFPRRTVTINQAVQETDDNKFILAEPKTAASRRTIVVPDDVMHALAQHWKRQIAEREQMGDKWDDALNLVFPNGYGGIMIPHNIAKRSYKRHLAAAGIPTTARFHDIRHTHITHLLVLGVNIKAVQERAGHSAVTITLSIYAHVMPPQQQAAVDASAALIALPAPVPAIVGSVGDDA